MEINWFILLTLKTLSPFNRNFYCLPAFVLHRGRVPLRLDTTEVQCKPVTFKGSNLTHPEFSIHVLSSINYYNESGLLTHDAAVTWVEKISSAGFSVCVLKAGRNDRLLTLGDNGMTFVDYIAYQGSPIGAVSGEKNISQWWEGTTCTSINLPAVRRRYQNIYWNKVF